MSKPPTQAELRDMLKDLLNIEEGLEDWEWGFIMNLSLWEGDYTDAQAAALERTWNKHCLNRVTANDG